MPIMFVIAGRWCRLLWFGDEEWSVVEFLNDDGSVMGRMFSAPGAVRTHG